MFHPINFEMKQAHLSSQRLLRRDTLTWGVTPARFDMIRAIFRCGCCVRQSWLPKLLGVSSPVVSIMVRALEKLGFVRRARSTVDRRTHAVALTMKAKAVLREIFYDTKTMGFHKMALASAFTKNYQAFPGWEVTIDRLETRLKAFRRAFGRGSASINPWHPMDDDADFFHARVKNNPNLIDLVPLDHELRWDGKLLAKEADDVREQFDPMREPRTSYVYEM